MSKLAIAVATLVLALATGPLRAAEPAPPSPQSQGEAEQALKEGFDQILRALDALMRSVPQYEMPEVQDNGDIVIRRKKQPNTPRQRRVPRSDEPSWT